MAVANFMPQWADFVFICVLTGFLQTAINWIWNRLRNLRRPKPETKPFGLGKNFPNWKPETRFWFGSNWVWIGFKPNFPNTTLWTLCHLLEVLDCFVGNNPYQQQMSVPSWGSSPRVLAHIVSHQIDIPYYNPQWSALHHIPHRIFQCCQKHR